MHDVIQQNEVMTTRALRSHLSGIAFIRTVLAPNGAVQSVAIAKTSGSSVIDQAAMDNVMLTNFPPFNADMPQKPTAFVVPIEIKNTSGD